MNNYNSRIIHERTKAIQIPQKSPTNKKEDYILNENEYSLKQNFFDPSKSSPPNEFMLKLKLRMTHYETSCIKDDKRINE